MAGANCRKIKSQNKFLIISKKPGFFFLFVSLSTIVFLFTF